MSARVLVAGGCRAGQLAEPQARVVAERIRPHLVQYILRRSDMGDNQFAAQVASRQQQVARLPAETRDGQYRRHGADVLTGIADDTARDVDGDDGQLAGGDRRQRLEGGACQWPVEAGAEQRIDDEFRTVHRCRRKWLDVLAPAFGMFMGRARKHIESAQQRERDVPARIHEDAGRRKAVAAVVAGSAQHHDPAPLPAPQDGVGDPAPCVLHQLRYRRAREYRQAVGLGHLDRGQEGGGVLHQAGASR